MTTSPPRPAVLVLDDDAGDRRLLATVLEREGYAVATAVDAAAARTMLDLRQFELVICDLNLPGESGASVVEHISSARPEIAVLVVSGGSDRATAERILALGAYGYLVKPFGIEQFLITVSSALRRGQLEQAHAQSELAHTQSELALKRAVSRRTAELMRSREETIRRLAAALDSRDGITGLHSERTARYSTAIARRLGLPEATCDLLSLAARIHDIGKLAIPDRVLHKPGSLSAEEWRLMETHTTVGYTMLAGSGEELLELAATLAWTHHERLDGSGYPRGLRGDAIPTPGRVVAVADTLDTLMSERPYRRAQTPAEAIHTLTTLRGSKLDPEGVDALIDSLESDPLRWGTDSSSNGNVPWELRGPGHDITGDSARLLGS